MRDVPPQDAGLTELEIRIVRAVASRGTIPGAADDLGLSHNTVRNRLSDIYRNVGVSGLLGLVVWAHRTRVIDLDEL